MAVRPEEIISKIIIDGSAAEEGTRRVSMSLNVMQNALNRALGGIDPLVKATMQFGREMTTLQGHIKNVATAQADQTKASESGATALTLLNSRMTVLQEMQRRLETGTLSLGQAQAVLSGKIKTTGDFLANGKAAYLGFMAQIDETAKAEYAHVQALDLQAAKLNELRDILKGAGLTLAEEAAAINKVTEAYDPLVAKQQAAIASHQELIDQINAYKADLGLVNVAEIKYAEGKDKLTSILRQANVGFVEATGILAAYAQKYDPLIQKEREEIASQEKLTATINKYRQELGLVDAEELKFIQGRDKLIALMREGNVGFAEATQMLEAYTQKYDPAIKAEKDKAEAEKRAGADRAKIKAQMLKEIDDEVAAQAKLASAYGQAVGQFDPLTALTLRYEDSLAKMRVGAVAAGKSQRDLAADEAKVTAAFEQAKKVILESEAANRRLAESGNLSRNSMLMLNASVINTVQSLSAGLPVSMVIMQQAPQLAGAFLQESSALTKVTTAAAGWIGTNAALAAGIGGTAAAFLLGATAALGYNSAITGLTGAMTLAGTNIGQSQASLEAFVETTATAAHVSNSFARETIQNFTAMGKIAPQTMQRIVGLTKDYAAVTGLSAADAAKKLGQQMQNPADSARTLAAEIGLLTQEEVRHIEVLEQSGDRMAAAAALMKAYEDRIKGARDQVNGLNRGWHDFTTIISDAWDAYGRGLSLFAFGDNSLEAQIVKANNALTEYLNYAQSRPGMYDPAEHQRLLLAYDALIKRRDALKQQALDAETNKEQAAIQSLMGTVTPMIGEYAKLESQINRLAAAWVNATGEQRRAIEVNLEAKNKRLFDLNAGGFNNETGLNAEGHTVEEERQKRLMAIETAYAGKISQTAREKKALAIAAVNQWAKERTGATETLAAENGLAQVRNAAIQQIAQQNANLTQSAKAAKLLGDAWMGSYDAVVDSIGRYAAANGIATLAEARSKAESDALTLSINVEARTRQYLAEAILQTVAAAAENVARQEMEVTASEKIVEATKKGIAAKTEAQRVAEFELETADLRAKKHIAEIAGMDEEVQRIQVLIDKYEELSKRKSKSKVDQGLADYGNELEHENELLRERQGLVGASASTKAEVNARRDVLNLLYRSGTEYDKLTDDQKKIVDGLIEQKKKQAELTLEVERQEDAWNTVTGSLGKAFETIGDAITKAFATGELRALDWKSVTKAAISSVVQDLLKLALINPFSNAVFGTNYGTLGSLLGGGGGSGIAGVAGGSAGTSGVVGQLQNAGISKGLSWAADKLGIGGSGGISGMVDSLGYNYLGIGTASSAIVPAVGGQAATVAATTINPATGSLAAYNGWGAAGAQGAGSGVAAGTGLSAYLSAAGAGALGGGLVGGTLGTMTNSKVVGGLSGAAAGAGSAYLASALGFGSIGGPVGIAIGAIVGAIMGMIGTQKATVGPNSSGNIVLNGSGGFRTDTALADNGADAGQMQAVTNAVATAMNTVVNGIGGTVSGGNGLNTGLIQQFAKDGKWYVTPQVGADKGKKATFDNQDEAIQYYMRSSLKGLIAEGKMTGVNKDVQKALDTSKATKAEDLATDLEFAKNFRMQFDLMNESLDPTNNQIKTFTENAAKLGESVKTSIMDWVTKAKELALEGDTAVTASAQKGIVALMGLGPATEPLRGMTAVTKQATIEFSAFQPALQALGFTAGQQSDLMSQYVEKAKKAYADAVAYVQRQGSVAIEQLVDPTKKTSGLDRLSGLGLDNKNSRIIALGSAIDKVDTAAGKGVLTIEDEREALATLNSALSDGYLTQEQYTTAVGYLTEAWNTGKEAAEKAATAAKNLAKYQSDVLVRAYSAAGMDRSSGLLALQYSQAAEMADAIANGYDTTLLKTVQNAEYAKKAFDLAQADVLGAYDQQINSQQDLIDSLENGAVKMAKIADQFKAAFNALAVNDNSPLSPEARLTELRGQIEEAYSTAKSATATDAQKETAREFLLNNGQTLVDLAKDYYASSNMDDYNRMRQIFAEFGDKQSLGVDKAEEQLQTAQNTLKELQEARKKAEQIGQKQYDKLDNLNSIMDQSYVIWQGMLVKLGGTTGTTGSTTNTAPRYSAPANVQSAWNALSSTEQFGVARRIGYTGSDLDGLNAYVQSHTSAFESEVLSAAEKRIKLAAFTNADIENYFGGFSDIQAVRAANPAFDLADWYWSTGMNEVLGGARRIPGFARGGYVSNGIYGTDSVFANLAGGEHITNAESVTAETAPTLDFINRTGRNPDWTNVGAGRTGRGAANDDRVLAALEKSNQLLESVVKMTDFYGKSNNHRLDANVQATIHGNRQLNSLASASVRQAARAR